MPPTALWSCMAAILETRLYFECKGHSDLDLWPSDLKPCLIVDVNEMHAHVKFKEHRPKSFHFMSKVKVLGQNDRQAPFFKRGHKNIWTKFRDDWTKNVTSRVLTRFHYSTIRKNAQTPAAMFFKRPQLFSNSPQISLKTNVLTKFYEDNKCHFSSVNKVSKQTHPSGGHNFQWTKTVCELGWDIIRTNVMTKFYYDLNKNLTLRLFPSFFVLNSA